MTRMIKSFISFWLTSFSFVGIIMLFFLAIGAPMIANFDPYIIDHDTENLNTTLFLIIFIIVILGFVILYISWNNQVISSDELSRNYRFFLAILFE